MGRNSRRKGKAWERAVANDMKKIFGQGVRRGWQSRQGDDEADNEGVPLMWIEAKHGKTSAASVFRAMDQAIKDSDHRWPVAICKDQRYRYWGNRSKPMIFVGMRKCDFEALLQKTARTVERAQVWDPDAEMPTFSYTSLVGKQPAYARNYMKHAQALEDSPEIAVLDVTKEGKQPIVVLGYEDFKLLLSVWHGSIVVYVGHELKKRLR